MSLVESTSWGIENKTQRSMEEEAAAYERSMAARQETLRRAVACLEEMGAGNLESKAAENVEVWKGVEMIGGLEKRQTGLRLKRTRPRGRNVGG